MDGGFQRTGRHQLGQPGHRLGQPGRRDHLVGELLVRPRPMFADFERMPGDSRFVGCVGRLDEALSQVGHRGERLLDREGCGGPRPDVPHRHRPEAPAPPSVAGLDLDGHVQQHGVGDHAAAELDRRAIGVPLGFRAGFQQADIRSLRHERLLRWEYQRGRRGLVGIGRRGTFRLPQPAHSVCRSFFRRTECAGYGVRRLLPKRGS